MTEKKFDSILKDFDITKDELVILNITLKNMKKGMSFEDSFKAAMETITTTWERVEYLPSTKKVATDYMFHELYKKHSDEL